uniref:ATP synthase complex subunit 8 n=1 Tax=Carpelimus fuliginosus TaxID=1587133 RepID=A0A343C163_9COLE|nr:ATP synthase F0 subunit 8 [Carpelimus fuliginosus]
MPQMSPLNWLILFMFFIIIFMMFNMLNYFNFFYKPSKTLQNIKKFPSNWKW